MCSFKGFYVRFAAIGHVYTVCINATVKDKIQSYMNSWYSCGCDLGLQTQLDCFCTYTTCSLGLHEGLDIGPDL